MQQPEDGLYQIGQLLLGRFYLVNTGTTQQYLLGWIVKGFFEPLMASFALNDMNCSPWIDLPERYGPRTTVFNRFNRWRKAGVWDRLMDAIIAAHETRGNDVQMIDSTSVRVHQQAAAQKKQSGDYHIGRSRGGLTTKLHLRVNGQGLPLQLELSAGEAHDAPMAACLLKDLPEGTSLLADRGYDANWIRELIYQQRCTPVIPPKSNRCDFIYYNKQQYKKRNLVERCFNKLKQFRHVATPQPIWLSQSSLQFDCDSDFMSPQPKLGL